MSTLLAVDWGTSTLRAARLDASGAVLEQRACAGGILAVSPGGFERELRALCGDWLAEARRVLVSGMAGSRQGWLEAPYCDCPASPAALAERLAWVEPGRVAIVPGVACEHAGVPDVMRGEETQVFGALELLDLANAQLVLPGTHSKWVEARAGRITGFRTFMTGELFALLREHSILARTLPAAHRETEDDAAFLQGVRHAGTAGSLLHGAFSARTLALFERLPAPARASYLSGLVIGEELRAQDGASALPLLVVGAPALARRYRLALEALGRPCRVLDEQASWRGLWRIARLLEEA